MYSSPWGLGSQLCESFFREARRAHDSSFSVKDLLDRTNWIAAADRLRAESPKDFPTGPRTGACPDMQSVHHHGPRFSDGGVKLSDLQPLLRRGFDEACAWARDVGIDVDRQLQAKTM